MTQEEILNDRIETLKDRYRQLLDSTMERLRIEKKNLDGELFDSSDIDSFSIMNSFMRLNAQLRELLYLRDRIANQAREKEPTS